VVCVRHPERVTGLSCVRCERPFCPQCLREASVGYQCVECAGVAPRTAFRPPWPVGAGGSGDAPPRSRAARTIAGAPLTSGLLVVPALIAMNVAVFVATVVQAGSPIDNAAAPLFQNWALQVPAVVEGQWWRLLTAGFLHIGVIHLLFNMVALWVIGRELEPVFGRGRFLAVYLVGLLGGSAGPFLFGDASTQVAGASGAVFGLMGGLAVVLRRLRLSARPALTLIGLNLVLSFVVPGISILGHLGGLVTGAAASAVLVHAPAGRHRTGWQTGGIAALAVALLLLMAVRVAMLS
jgi:membrane associated rhomboid family serine protease